MVFGRGGCVFRGGGVGELGATAVRKASPGDVDGNAVLAPSEPLAETERLAAPGMGTGDVPRAGSSFLDALRSSTLARISAKVVLEVISRAGSRSPASGPSASCSSFTPGSRRSFAHVAPHLRIVSFAWAPSACLSVAAALAFSWFKKLDA
jgi:hypothetical protein